MARAIRAQTASGWAVLSLVRRAHTNEQLTQRIGAQAAAGCAVVDMAPLSAAHGFAELWRVCGDGPVVQYRRGDLTWSVDRSLLFAHLTLDERAFGDGTHCALEPAAHAIYRSLFALLADTGFLHPIRFWNYLPRINVDEDGLERYRHFNIGRHAAFVEAQRPTDAAPPAACALGCRGSAMTVIVLAGRTPPVAIENPRQVSAYRYPSQYGPRAPTFSRAALYRRGAHALLTVSGTASIVGHETLHIGDVAGQVDESLRNLEAVVDAANAAAGQPTFQRRRAQDEGLCAQPRSTRTSSAVSCSCACRKRRCRWCGPRSAARTCCSKSKRPAQPKGRQPERGFSDAE